ncbi:uncharacterized protein LOC115720437 [Cannabis sativa]|uniref:uncharacterized protein LOC115720437 n=1 Tax=Cannabis sativa TaxID=3483 RepID=UPI0029CA655F|nr:uncharacterized protein LOC115720437 [Cannabis sativa]
MRCLRDFNLALLEKQYWRLLVNVDSLVSRLYEAKYYATGNQFSAVLGDNPSFIWCSILEAKDLIHACAQRTIADGENVSILNDPWLPHNSNNYVVSRHPALVNKSVSCLFQVGTRAWDEDVVRDLFVARDQDLILSIQLSDSAANDGWSWRLETCGNCSLKTVSGVLPTCFQLQKRHVPVNADCPLCNSSTKTIHHALVECSFAKAAWHRSIVDIGAGAVTFCSW